MTMHWIKQLFAGQPTHGKPPASAASVVGLALLAAAAGWGLWATVQQRLNVPPPGIVGTHTTTTAHALQGLATQLDAALATGNQAAAGPLFNQLTPILQRLNDNPATAGSGNAATALQHCVLAASHLTQGVDGLYSGGTGWHKRNQFLAALAICDG